MSNDSIKKRLHSYIDSINDEAALHLLQEAAEAYSTKQPDILDQLSTPQQERLQQSIQQVKDGKIIPNEEVVKKAQQWLTK